jgi:hypothetical protein
MVASPCCTVSVVIGRASRNRTGTEDGPLAMVGAAALAGRLYHSRLPPRSMVMPVSMELGSTEMTSARCSAACLGSVAGTMPSNRAEHDITDWNDADTSAKPAKAIGHQSSQSPAGRHAQDLAHRDALLVRPAGRGQDHRQAVFSDLDRVAAGLWQGQSTPCRPGRCGGSIAPWRLASCRPALVGASWCNRHGSKPTTGAQVLAAVIAANAHSDSSSKMLAFDLRDH